MLPEPPQPEFVYPPSRAPQARSLVRSIVGIDGCRGGWVIAESPAFTLHPVRIRIIRELAGDHMLAHALAAGALIAIDMPIGLPSTSHPAPRRCDGAARAELGPRGSSVFGVPCREAVAEPEYRAALALNRRVLGTGISKQAHNICNKIAELDRWLSALGPARESFFETHPELTVGRLANANSLDQIHRKKDAVGQRQRVALLESEGLFNVQPLVDRAMKSSDQTGVVVAADDVIDALLCLLVARRAAQGLATPLPGDTSPRRDERGLLMQIWV